MKKIIFISILFIFNYSFAQVNINTANTDELQLLSGIGEKKAKQLIKYRKENGKFKKVSDISNVKGIGEKILSKIKKDISVSGKTNLDNVSKKKKKPLKGKKSLKGKKNSKVKKSSKKKSK